jgi:hypothetical protein
MNPGMSHPVALGDGVFRRCVTINPKGLRDGIGRLTLCGPLAIYWRSSIPIFGLPILMPLAFARAIPAFVLSLISLHLTQRGQKGP